MPAIAATDTTLALIGKGTLPKDGKVPQPQYMISKIKANKGTTDGLTVADMYDDYRKVHKNVELVVSYFKEMGLVVLKAGSTLTKGKFEGTLDLIVECTKTIIFSDGSRWEKGDKFIIDLKYSGLMGESVQWKNKHGWQWSNVQKEYHGTQAKQYSYVGGGMQFYFMVIQSNNDADKDPMVRLFYVPISKDMTERHLEEGVSLFEKFNTTAEFGFVARPSFVKCCGCPLRGECTDRHTFPQPELVDLTLTD